MPRRTLHLTNPYMHDGQNKTHPIDVTYAQRLLNNTLTNSLHTDFFAGSLDGVYGEFSAQAARKAKYWFGYPKSQIDGACGQKLIDLLHGDRKMSLVEKWRRAYRIRYYNSHQNKRAKIVAYLRWGVSHEPYIHYLQRRPMPLANLYLLPAWRDCSEFATCAYKAAGAPDPNGLGFNGLGYTGTMLGHCIHIPQAALKPGDLVVYGPFPGHHVSIVVEAGFDPLLVSHGREAGPEFTHLSNQRLSQESAGHYGVTFCRVPGLE